MRHHFSLKDILKCNSKLLQLLRCIQCRVLTWSGSTGITLSGGKVGGILHSGPSLEHWLTVRIKLDRRLRVCNAPDRLLLWLLDAVLNLALVFNAV